MTRAAVVVFPGSNGDRDLFQAFAAAGFETQWLDARQDVPEDVDVVGLPGGFSYGDYWRAGMLASQSPAVLSLKSVVARGGLVIGICNGFQILCEAGYLPCALIHNAPPGFRHSWVSLKGMDKRSPWFSGMPENASLRMPRAHGEGNVVFTQEGQSPCLKYSQNPNGSAQDAAAVLDESGQILGIMPHPERAIFEHLGSSDGLALFKSAYRYLQDRQTN